jgi:outer membrane protein assembly factor BamE
MRRIITAVFLAACCLASGCAWVSSLGVYKIDVNQGNFITQDTVEKLRVGQTKSQVRLILGTPLLADAFHTNRWDYVYRFQHQGKVIEDRRLVVEFKDDKLERWSGDQLPISPIRGYEGARSDGVTTTLSGDTGWWGRFKDFLGL